MRRTSLAQRPHRAAAGDRRTSGSSPLAHRPRAHRPGRQGGGGRQPCAHRSSHCGAERSPPAWRRGQGWAFLPPARSPGPARRTRPTTARPPRRRNPGRNAQGKRSRANRRTAGRYRAKPVSTPARSAWAAQCRLPLPQRDRMTGGNPEPRHAARRAWLGWNCRTWFTPSNWSIRTGANGPRRGEPGYLWHVGVCRKVTGSARN